MMRLHIIAFKFTTLKFWVFFKYKNLQPIFHDGVSDFMMPILLFFYDTDVFKFLNMLKLRSYNSET